MKTTMTDEEMRVKVAEACGWKIPDHCKTKRLMRGETKRQVAGAPPDFGLRPDTAKGWMDLPDYLNDLNAMHEAEKTLTTDEEIATFCNHLNDVAGADMPNDSASFVAYFATARQRAEAFLKTKGLL